MSLVENTPKGANRDLALLRHDRGIHRLARTANELDMAAPLAGFDEAYGF
jgi:hypothetical protein